MKLLSLLSLVLIIQIASCKKNSLSIKDSPLTTCPENAECSYVFTEHSDIQSNGLIQGDYRVFKSVIQIPVFSYKQESTLWIKAPMQSDEFLLRPDEIKNGFVKYLNSDILLRNTVDLKPVGGFVKGKNLSPGNPAEQTKWLIEAEIIMATVEGNMPLDTLHLKQYFYPNFVYD